MTVGTSCPGVAQHVHDALADAAGWPPNMTVGLPDTTRPTCIGGTMYGSDGCSPTWGGVFTPDEPMTAAGLLPMRTVATVPIVSGAENGIGGPGCGAPVAGFGIR